MLAAWCVVVACVGSAVAAPFVSVQVGGGGVDVGVGPHGTRRASGRTVDVGVGGLVDVGVSAPDHTGTKTVDVNVGGGLVDVGVSAPDHTHTRSFSKPVDVDVGSRGVNVDVGQPRDTHTSGFTKVVDVNVGGGRVSAPDRTHTRSFSKPVEVDVGSKGVNVDVGQPHDTHTSGFTKVVDVNVGGGHPHTHTHHVFKTHSVDPNFRNTETYAALDQAGSRLFQGLGNAATALGDFLARLAGGGRH